MSSNKGGGGAALPVTVPVPVPGERRRSRSSRRSRRTSVSYCPARTAIAENCCSSPRSLLDKGNNIKMEHTYTLQKI